MSSSVEVGAVPPPPGITPNFVNPDYNDGGTVPVTAVFLTLSTIALSLRVYTKARVVKLFGAEDCMYKFPLVVYILWLIRFIDIVILAYVCRSRPMPIIQRNRKTHIIIDIQCSLRGVRFR